MKNNYSLNLNTCLSLFFFLCMLESYSQVYDFQNLRDRVTASQREKITQTTNLDSWVGSQNPDGSWFDLPYGNNVNSTTSNNHVYRLWHIAAACTTASHAKYNNTAYMEAVKKGLQYWKDSNTKDTNWWYNRIHFPQKLGEILIFMREFDGFIPKTSSAGIDEPEILSLFFPTAQSGITADGTGANAIDVAMHYVYRGLLTENKTLLENTRNTVEAILTEHIEGDLMYHDHGPQIMTASYGWVFCEGLIRLASYLSGSPAAFDTNHEKFGKVISFIRDTQATSTRGKSWDFSVLGRGVSRQNAMNANMGYLQTLADYIDPVNSTEYLDALARLKGSKAPNYNVKEFNKHYWVSDYTQHARSEYLFTVRNVSTRTAESETGNGENLKANYFSYGANFISIDGTEYTNIMPVWDWSMIPGTTFPYTTVFPSRSIWGNNLGATNFVGGVSDGVHGASVLDLNHVGIKAKKSWFFFDNEIVCLGAGIVDNSNRNVRTAINQAWLTDISYYSEVGSTAETSQNLSSNEYSKTNLKYIRNGKFGYYFPNQENVKYTMKIQSGNWKSINVDGSNANQSGYVFSLWLDHGVNPNNADYSYIVVPGIDNKTKAQSYDANVIKIIENSASKQAVYHTGLDILQVIFYEAGTVSYGNKSITVNNPCVLMFKKGTSVTVSNPSQTYVGVNVTVTVDGIAYTKPVVLPNSSTKKGSSTTVDFQDVLSVNDVARKSNITTFYPNPTQGMLHLKVNSDSLLNYKIVAVDGKTILNGQFFRETILDLSNCHSGLYFLKIIDGNKNISTHKIIKH